MRRLPLRPLTAAVAVLTLLAGCSSSAPSPRGQNNTTAPSSRAGLVGTTNNQQGTRVGPTDPKRQISLSISMASIRGPSASCTSPTAYGSEASKAG